MIKKEHHDESVQFLDDFAHPDQERYKIIEMSIQAESFLYKMIRKMFGVAVDVASGKYPIETIEKMMLNPPDYYETLNSTILKPNGLYLKSVEYSPDEF
jgi:tRNA pseudouridine(38-40) synthase